MNNSKLMEKPSLGHVRILHAVPDAPNVDVYANDKLVASNLSYSNYTKYMPLPEGTYKIALYATGTTDDPVLTNMLTLNENDIFTIAATGTLNNIGLLGISDPDAPIENNKAMIRFAHLSPNAPAVDITLPDGTVLFSNIPFKQVTSYISVPPSDYTLQVRLAGTPTVVLTVPDVTLEPNKYYTAYALGLVGESPELEALLVLDSDGLV